MDKQATKAVKKKGEKSHMHSVEISLARIHAEVLGVNKLPGVDAANTR